MLLINNESYPRNDNADIVRSTDIEKNVHVTDQLFKLNVKYQDISLFYNTMLLKTI